MELAIHMAKLTDYTAFDVDKRAIVKFIRIAINETWYKDLKDAKSFYTEVTAFNLLDHLD